MFWQFFTAFGIMMGYFSGAAFRGVLDGTKDSLCPQPASPPPLTPSPLTSDKQKMLLALRCVSASLMIVLCVFRTLSTYQEVKALFP